MVTARRATKSRMMATVRRLTGNEVDDDDDGDGAMGDNNNDDDDGDDDDDGNGNGAIASKLIALAAQQSGFASSAMLRMLYQS
jgi:hypothetical protein